MEREPAVEDALRKLQGLCSEYLAFCGVPSLLPELTDAEPVRYLPGLRTFCCSRGGGVAAGKRLSPVVNATRPAPEAGCPPAPEAGFPPAPDGSPTPDAVSPARDADVSPVPVAADATSDTGGPTPEVVAPPAKPRVVKARESDAEHEERTASRGRGGRGRGGRGRGRGGLQPAGRRGARRKVFDCDDNVPPPQEPKPMYHRFQQLGQVESYHKWKQEGPKEYVAKRRESTPPRPAQQRRRIAARDETPSESPAPRAPATIKLLGRKAGPQKGGKRKRADLSEELNTRGLIDDDDSSSDVLDKCADATSERDGSVAGPQASPRRPGQTKAKSSGRGKRARRDDGEDSERARSVSVTSSLRDQADKWLDTVIPVLVQYTRKMSAPPSTMQQLTSMGRLRDLSVAQLQLLSAVVAERRDLSANLQGLFWKLFQDASFSALMDCQRKLEEWKSGAVWAALNGANAADVRNVLARVYNSNPKTRPGLEVVYPQMSEVWKVVRARQARAAGMCAISAALCAAALAVV
eukprot:TRINITY_DN4391_c4_g1_i1.p1 TRINITY_DN4391_c4_g1~~TRINITY_DN4391_c4_g1_i1.p1  ORF type:complete len:522 (+),score=109.70 TRINITY_DN4391_c4_g1_i1:57-1622(+)